MAWPFLDQKADMFRNNPRGLAEICEIRRQQDLLSGPGVSISVRDTQASIGLAMEGVELSECAVIAGVVDIVAIAMHHAAVHVRLLACEARVRPIAVEGRDLRDSHPVDNAVVCLQVRRPCSDYEVAHARMLSDDRLAIGKRAYPPEWVGRKSEVMFNNVGVNSAHGSALVAFGVRLCCPLTARPFPDVLLTLQSRR